MRIRFSRVAAQGIRQIGDALRTERPSMAVQAREALLHALEVIATHPAAGRLQSRDIRRLEVPRYPFLIFYRVDMAAGEIGVAAVRGGPPL
jgi:toxin ParE1/3/4